jgi:C4-dicarboxylate-specific signal transduction histidine kinase
MMAEWSRGDHKRMVIRLRRKDGAECWMVVSGSMEKDAEGRSVGGQGMAIDVTRQKADERRFERMESQLRHASRLATLGELSAGIAHEINQPLCSIVNFAKACKNVALQPQPNLQHIREWSEAIATAASRSGDIVRRLCGFARRSQNQPVAVSIQELVNDATLLMRFELQNRKVTLCQEMPDHTLKVLVYPVQIHQVLVNLLRNAIEAIDGDKGQLTIRARPQPGEVHVSVTDNGIGLPTQATGDIFDAFFTTKREGLGLGLAVSRSIVESHHGRIWAQANPDCGASVHFTLPLHEGGSVNASLSNGLRD